MITLLEIIKGINSYTQLEKNVDLFLGHVETTGSRHRQSIASLIT